MTLDDWLTRWATEIPDRPALDAEGRLLTYRELDEEVGFAAGDLARNGVEVGETVAVTAHAGLGYVLELHALSRLGAISYPLDPRLGPEEIEAARAETEHPTGVDPAEVHCRVLTSGTSGLPRPVELTHANFRWSAIGSALNLGVEPGDRWLCCLPLFHVSGLSIVIRSAIYGTTAVIHDGFDTDRVAAALEGDRISLVSLVGTQLVRLLEAGADLARPRAILIGGGPLPAELLEEAVGRGAQLVQTYGLTEACSQVATLAPADAKRKLGSAGRPLLSAEIRVDDGEILVRGPTVAPASVAPDGWLHTGDLGRIDDEGFLYVTGRRSELIVSGGENVMPSEVEAVLLRHPSVDDAAVVGRPDPEWQEAVSAVVVLHDGASASEAELREHCAALLAPFKVPKRIDFATALPRTAAGKLLRHQLA